MNKNNKTVNNQEGAMQSVKVDDFYGFPCETDRRVTAICFVEVIMSNPNGDPAFGGRPRIDDVSGFGRMTGVSIKRKQRDYLIERLGETHYLHPGSNLSRTLETGGSPDEMVKKYRDLRYFGGTLTKIGNDTKNSAMLRAPFQYSDAFSLHKVEFVRTKTTRVVKVDRERIDNEGNTEAFEGGNLIPERDVVRYGLYRFKVQYEPAAGRRLGVSEEDMTLFWESLFECWDMFKATMRFHVQLRRVYAFSQPIARGVAPSHVIDRWVKVTCPIVDSGEEVAPQQFEDYEFQVETCLPAGIEAFEWVDGRTSSQMAAAAK